MIINSILDVYVEEKRNVHAERKCKHPKSIAQHLQCIRAEWGHMEMADFAQGSKGRVREVVARWRTERKWCSTTCRKRLSIFKAAINHAIDEELIPRTLEPVIKLPPQGPPRERFIDPVTELPLILAEADRSRTPRHTLLALNLYLRTGLRPSSIRDLTWDLVDFERRVIWFQETEAFEDRTKKRRVNKPMDDDLFELMQREYGNRDEDCPYVVSWRGKQCKTVYHSMKQVFKRAGFPDIQPRDMRRTSATYVYNENEGDASLTANHIGDTEAITMKHYAKADPQVTLPAVQTISRVMMRARAARPRGYRSRVE